MNDQLSTGFLRAVLDAIPSPVFIVDNDIRILAYNQAATPLLGSNPSMVLHMRGGEALHCLNAIETGCGFSLHCQSCVVRKSVQASFDNQKVIRHRSKMTLVGDSGNSEVYLQVTTAPLHHEGGAYIVLILEDVSEMVELRKLVPICASCKKIRNEKQYWDSLESYFKRRMDIDFTHGICPECFERLYPELARTWKTSGEPAV